MDREQSDSWQRGLRRFLLLGLIIFAVGIADMPSGSADIAPPPSLSSQKPAAVCSEYSAPIKLARVQSALLNEISGMDVDASNPDVIWVHNDSGDGPNIYAIDRKGALLGKLVLKNVKAIDWEDMAIGKCGKSRCIYIADTGDNHHLRESVDVYRLPLPMINPTKPFVKKIITDFERFQITYPDKKENVEAFTVLPNEEILLFAKNKSGTPAIYLVEHPKQGQTNPAKKIGTIDITQGQSQNGQSKKITAAAIHPSQQAMLLRTYDEIWEVRIEKKGGIGFWENPVMRTVPQATEKQSEAIAYDPKTGGYLHISEGHKPFIYSVTCKKPK